MNDGTASRPRVTPSEYLKGIQSGMASVQGEMSLVNASVREAAARQFQGPYPIRLKRPVGQIPSDTIGTVVEHWEDGIAAEVEFYVDIGTGHHEHFTETVEFENMEDAVKENSGKCTLNMQANMQEQCRS